MKSHKKQQEHQQQRLKRWNISKLRPQP